VIDRVRIGELEIDPLTFEQALDAIVALVRRGEGGTVFTPNVDHVVQVEDDERLRAAYRDASLSLVDGMPVLWAARLLGRRLPEKISGSDLIVPLMERAANERLRVFLLGGGPNIADAAASKLCATFRELRIVGTEAPWIDLDRDAPWHDALIDRIREAHPQLVLVAFGCPKQEIFMHRAALSLRPSVLVGVGAALDFVAGRAPRAPSWMSRAGLEWVQRLAREPRRLGPRYLARDPRFLSILFRSLLRSRRHETRREPDALENRTPVPPPECIPESTVPSSRTKAAAAPMVDA